MKNKTLKYFMLTLSCVFALSLLLACAGCRLKDDKIYSDGYFQYIVVGENGGQPDKNNNEVVAIIGFTYEGTQQVVIEFPREIDGKPVRYIGYRKPRYYSEIYYELESDNLKRVYIHDNIKYVNRDAFGGIKDYENLQVMFCSAQDPYQVFYEMSRCKFYFYKSAYYPDFFEESTVRYAANVVFVNNYSYLVNDSYYSLDYVSAGEKIHAPLNNPVRDRWNEFTGWYTEPECINKWGFDDSPVIAEGEEFKLYAGWDRVDYPVEQ